MKPKTFGDVAEEQRWQEFVDNYDNVHPSAQMPDGCYTCKVGSRWSQEDNEELISMVQPGVSLEEMARKLNRSLLGIVGRLQLMGIIRAEGAGYDDFTYNNRVSYITMEYRYSKTKKLCYDMKPFMEENWERLGWEKSRYGFSLPSEIRNKRIDKGRFNPSWKRRTKPARDALIAAESKERIVAAKEKKEMNAHQLMMHRRANPRLTRKGLPDKRFKYQN